MGTGAFFHSVLLSKYSVNRKTSIRQLTAEEIARVQKGTVPKDDTDAWYVTNKSEMSLVSLRGERLHADVIMQGEHSHKWIIIGHGWTNHPQGMSNFARVFYDMGFNVLLPFSGGHGRSEKKIVSMGWDDRLDWLDWINYITLLYPDAIFALHGVSMGAATVMMTAGEELPSNVKCAIEDCGFTTLPDMGSSIVESSMHLPPWFFISAARTYTRLVDGMDINDVSPVDQIRKCKIPMLFIHGEKDSFVPFRMMDVLYDTAKCEKQKLAVPGADHTESCHKHPELYWPAVSEFLNKYVK